MNRRDLLKSLGLATAATAAGALSSAQAAEPGATPPEGQPQNPYGGKPNTGITLPPYYRPTPSVNNSNTFMPGTEELGDDERRISFIGSTPVPPTRSQAGTSIMVELGPDKRFFFDFGNGALKISACTIGSPPQGAPVSVLRQGGTIKTVGCFRCYCP